MCLICAGIAATVAGTALVVKGVRRTWPKPSSNYPPAPKPQPAPVYGEDLED